MWEKIACCLSAKPAWRRSNRFPDHPWSFCGGSWHQSPTHPGCGCWPPKNTTGRFQGRNCSVMRDQLKRSWTIPTALRKSGRLLKQNYPTRVKTILSNPTRSKSCCAQSRRNICAMCPTKTLPGTARGSVGGNGQNSTGSEGSGLNWHLHVTGRAVERVSKVLFSNVLKLEQGWGNCKSQLTVKAVGGPARI